MKLRKAKRKFSWSQYEPDESSSPVISDVKTVSSNEEPGNEKKQFVKAKNSALKFLGLRAHTEYELRQKLLKKEFNPEIVDKVISELRSYDFLNDTKFASDFISSKIKIKKDGLYKISKQLSLKGIDKQIVKDLISQYVDEDKLKENAVRLCRDKIKYLSGKELSRDKLKQRLILYLQNKGYSTDIIISAFKELEL
ncbi:MAG: regulatory protein RecX [Melioribacteraceae bacterium]|nr:regulatory protein RecX [Melioribacteraceae bacterium]